MLLQMALALQHMHAKNMAHMDVKPDNIYVLDETNYKLGDFGLAASSCSSKHGSHEEGDARYFMHARLHSCAVRLTPVSSQQCSGAA